MATHHLRVSLQTKLTMGGHPWIEFHQFINKSKLRAVRQGGKSWLKQTTGQSGIGLFPQVTSGFVRRPSLSLSRCAASHPRRQVVA
jgi:hypothetical protein